MSNTKQTPTIEELRELRKVGWAGPGITSQMFDGILDHLAALEAKPAAEKPLFVEGQEFRHHKENGPEGNPDRWRVTGGVVQFWNTGWNESSYRGIPAFESAIRSGELIPVEPDFIHATLCDSTALKSVTCPRCLSKSMDASGDGDGLEDEVSSTLDNWLNNDSDTRKEMTVIADLIRSHATDLTRKLGEADKDSERFRLLLEEIGNGFAANTPYRDIPLKVTQIRTLLRMNREENGKLNAQLKERDETIAGLREKLADKTAAHEAAKHLLLKTAHERNGLRKLDTTYREMLRREGFACPDASEQDLDATLILPLAKIAELKELLSKATETFGHGHWDSTMNHGAGCPICIQQSEIRSRIAITLAAKQPSVLDEQVGTP
jgi:hypothetical protein